LALAQCRTKDSTAILLVVFAARQETRSISPVDGRKCSVTSGIVWAGDETYIQAEYILLSELVLRLKVRLSRILPFPLYGYMVSLSKKITSDRLKEANFLSKD